MSVLTSKQIALLGLLAAVVSCTTASIPTYDPILVPSGLSPQKIEVAIFSGILHTPPPPDFPPPGPPLPDDQFQKLLWEHFPRGVRSELWFPESRAPGVVYAAVNEHGHYLRVALAFDPSTVQTQIVASEHLDQTDGKIHKRALNWVSQLRGHIRRALHQMSASKRPAR